MLEIRNRRQLQEIKNIMNGCSQSCPMCRRKCDNQNYQDKNHKHQCSNGHQLRGMAAVLIRSSPSLFSCEEMDDETQIQTQNNSKYITWKDIKKEYHGWSFKERLYYKKINENTLKFKQIWNGGIGELVCQILTEELNKNVIQKKKYDNHIKDSFKPIHFIFVLDYSGSMKNSWSSVINCVKSSFQEIRFKTARVSVILFNDKANIVINCEILKIEEHLKLLTYQGGDTDFGPAFKATLMLLQQNPEYSCSIILFYTDGLADYPKAEMKEIKNLKQQIKDTLCFLACSKPHKNSSLELILDAFKNSCAYAEWRDKIEPSTLNKNWAEMIFSTNL